MGGLTSALGAENTYQATAPDIQRQNFANAIQSSQGQFDQSFANQQALSNQLAQQAQGAGPNLAEQQLRDATARNIAQSQGMVASAKGISPALAQRLAAQNAAMSNQAAAGQAAQTRMQQQLAAQAQLGNVSGQMGQQALGLQGTLQNAQAAQNQAINQAVLGTNQINAGVAADNSATNRAIIGGLISAGGQAGAASAGGMPVPAYSGAVVPNTPGMIPGDHPQNDIVDAKLSPGEIVIPRSVAMSQDAPEKAKEFVEMLKSQKKMSKGGVVDFKDVVATQKKLAERLAALEKRMGK